MMVAKGVQIGLACIASTAIAATLYQHWQGSANQHAKAGEAAIEQGDAVDIAASDKYRELFSEQRLREFPENREQFKQTATEVAALFEKAAEQYRVAASRFQQVGQQRIDAEAIEYWKLKRRSAEELADSKEILRRLSLLWLDESIHDMQTMHDKIAPLADEATVMVKNSRELTAQAAKLREAHPAKFK